MSTYIGTSSTATYCNCPSTEPKEAAYHLDVLVVKHPTPSLPSSALLGE